jgi:hypothetical protein
LAFSKDHLVQVLFEMFLFKMIEALKQKLTKKEERMPEGRSEPRRNPGTSFAVIENEENQKGGCKSDQHEEPCPMNPFSSSPRITPNLCPPQSDDR